MHNFSLPRYLLKALESGEFVTGFQVTEFIQHWAKGSHWLVIYSDRWNVLVLSFYFLTGEDRAGGNVEGSIF